MPRWSSTLNRWIRGDSKTLKASGAETVSTTGTGLEGGGHGSLAVIVDVTAASGTTPTLLVDIEGSDDGTNWAVIGTIGSNGYRTGSVGTAPANITATGTHRAFLPAARHVRYKSTIAGTTPSFTYSVTAEAS